MTAKLVIQRLRIQWSADTGSQLDQPFGCPD